MVEYLISDWLPRFGLSDFRIPYHGLQVFQLSSKFIWPGCLDKEAQHGAGLVKVFLLFTSVTFYRSCSQFTLTSHLQDFSACKKKFKEVFFVFIFTHIFKICVGACNLFMDIQTPECKHWVWFYIYSSMMFFF